MKPRQGPLGPKKGQKAMMVAGMVVVVVLAVVGLVVLVRAKVLGGLAAQELERRLQGEGRQLRPAARAGGQGEAPGQGREQGGGRPLGARPGAARLLPAGAAPTPHLPSLLLMLLTLLLLLAGRWRRRTRRLPCSWCRRNHRGLSSRSTIHSVVDLKKKPTKPQLETPRQSQSKLHFQLSPMQLCEAQMVEVNLVPKLC